MKAFHALRDRQQLHMHNAMNESFANGLKFCLAAFPEDEWDHSMLQQPQFVVTL
jgi:hypothetical protein